VGRSSLVESRKVKICLDDHRKTLSRLSLAPRRERLAAFGMDKWIQQQFKPRKLQVEVWNV
jgi:hypothetical protein